MSALLTEILNCNYCQPQLPCTAKPILQFKASASILIAGHAPGQKTHDKGIPFDDASGRRLRQWLDVSDEQFYNAELFSILPMGFCYPGTAKNGDLPPRPECATRWRSQLMAKLDQLQLTIVLGRYAMDYHWPHCNPTNKSQTLTQAAQLWQQTLPQLIVLPHPSPRNNRWLKNNPWFEQQTLPQLKKRVKVIIQSQQ